jgi:anti-anti-sigma factor
MQIEESRARGAVVLALAGRVDSTTSAALESHLAGLTAAGEPRLVVDFSGVDYISSAGLRVMLALAKGVRDLKGGLALCGMGDAVRQVFALAGFLPLFAVTESRDAALRQVTGEIG